MPWFLAGSMIPFYGERVCAGRGCRKAAERLKASCGKRHTTKARSNGREVHRPVPLSPNRAFTRGSSMPSSSLESEGSHSTGGQAADAIASHLPTPFVYDLLCCRQASCSEERLLQRVPPPSRDESPIWHLARLVRCLADHQPSVRNVYLVRPDLRLQDNLSAVPSGVGSQRLPNRSGETRGSDRRVYRPAQRGGGCRQLSTPFRAARFAASPRNACRVPSGPL